MMTITDFRHAVRTFDENGNMVYEAHFETAEKAYAEYVDIIENLKEYGVPGRYVTVVRYRDNRVMTMAKAGR